RDWWISSRNASRSSPARRILAELAFCAALLVAFAVSTPPAGADPQSLPPGHWAYGELEHFEARGWLHLPGARPYSRTQVRRWVIALGAHDDALGAGGRGRVARLEAEFVDSLVARRDDPPLVHFTDDPWRVDGDVDVRGGGDADHGDRGLGWGRSRF